MDDWFKLIDGSCDLWSRAVQDLCDVDFRRQADGWPMVGFIMMVDEFRTDNGATRFVPGSHKWPTLPTDFQKDTSADYEGQVVYRPGTRRTHVRRHSKHIVNGLREAV